MFFIVITMFLFSGCSKYVLVRYNDVEPNNSVEISLTTGQKLKGVILEILPYRIQLLKEDRSKEIIPQSGIRSIKRLPPVYDDFGKAIPEDEIETVKTNRNAFIYGIGGGALSLGASFFIGSMIANNVQENGATVLKTTTAGGGLLGTTLFVRAGMKKDRRDAIRAVQEKRRSTELKTEDTPKTGDVDTLLEAEKMKHEALRREREKILRELQKKKKG